MKISAENKTVLTTLDESVNAALKIALKGTGDLESLIADEQKRNDEVVAIESGIDYADTKGVNSLETKKSQLAQLRRQIEKVQQSASTRLDTLNATMRGVHEILWPAVESAWRAEVVEIAKTILPYHGDWSGSLRLACNTTKANAARHYYGRRYGLGSSPIGEARHVVKVLDAVLDDKDPMPWSVEEPPAEIPFYFPWERH